MIKWINKKRNQKGFTLIELVVVIAILGILAALAIPRLTGFQASAREKADLATFTTIDKAIAILLSDGTIKADGTVTATSDDAGDITIGGDATGGTGDTNTAAGVKAAMEAILGEIKFQSAAALDKTYEWTIDVDTGDITPPTFP